MRRKENVLILQVIILFIFGIIGCEDTTNTEEPNMDFIYPLSVGSSWQYERQITNDYDSLATSYGLSDTTEYSSHLVEIVNNEIIFDTLNVYNFETTIDENGRITEGNGNEYFNNINNSLISYGYFECPIITPKINKKYSYIIFENKKFNNVIEIIHWIERGYYDYEYSKEDSIIFDPVKSLDYPLEEGKQWIYRNYDYGGYPHRIDKEIIESVQIEVPAGKFNCWKIQWFDEIFEDMFMFDYISEEGLIKRTIIFNDLTVMDENGNIIGYFDSINETSLVDYTIE